MQHVKRHAWIEVIIDKNTGLAYSFDDNGKEVKQIAIFNHDVARLVGEIDRLMEVIRAQGTQDSGGTSETAGDVPHLP